ncbi:hypothetical protein CAPN008_14210 [Capnocytophaga canis]|nr:hypothetical protein CAPN008_14210 [Capnocytophaga canis]
MLFDYVENGANAGSTDERVDMAFEFIKMDMDYYDEAYQKKKEAKKENGKKGGNPNFKKGQSNPYYSKEKDNLNITEDNLTLPKITKDKHIDIDIDIDNNTPQPPQGELIGDFQDSELANSQEPNETPDLKTEKEKNETDSTGGADEVEKIDFDRLLTAISEITGREFRVINEAVKKKYRARLKEGYTKADIFNAIKNATKDKYHNETGRKYLTPEFFSRSQTIDKYKDSAESKPKTSQKFQVGDL